MGQNISTTGGEDDDLEVPEKLPFKLTTFIPDDIIYMVFTFLNPKDIRSVKLCSKRFHFLAQLAGQTYKFSGNACRDPKVVEDIVQKLTSEKNAKLFRRICLDTLLIRDDGMRIIAMNCVNLCDLSLQNCHAVGDVSCEYLSTYCRNLRSLNIIGIGELTKKGYESLSTIPLTTLYLNDVSKSDMGKDASLIYHYFSHGHKAQSLKKLYVSFHGYSFSQPTPTSIKCGKNKEFFKNLPKTEQGYPALRELELVGFNYNPLIKTNVGWGGYYNDFVWRGEEERIFLGSLFPNLRTLSVSSKYHSNGSTISLLLFSEITKDLRHLRTSDLPEFKDNEELRHLDRFEHLQTFTALCDTNNYVNHRERSFLVSKFSNMGKNLKVLDIRNRKIGWGAKDIDKELEIFVRSFKSLEKLRLSFMNVPRRLFNSIVVPYLTSLSPKLTLLDLYPPHGDEEPIDFSFLQELVICEVLALRGLVDERGAKDAVQQILTYSENLTSLKELNLIGMKVLNRSRKRIYPTKEVVRSLLSSLPGLKELMMFRTGLRPMDFVQLLEKYKKVKVFLT